MASAKSVRVDNNGKIFIVDSKKNTVKQVEPQDPLLKLILKVGRPVELAGGAENETLSKLLSVASKDAGTYGMLKGILEKQIKLTPEEQEFEDLLMEQSIEMGEPEPTVSQTMAGAKRGREEEMEGPSPKNPATAEQRQGGQRNGTERRAHNLNVGLEGCCTMILSVFEKAGLTSLESKVEQNCETALRVILMGLGDEPIKARDGRGGTVDEITANFVKEDGSVQELKMKIEEVRSIVRINIPGGEKYQTNPGSKMTRESLFAVAIGYLAKAVGTSDKFFAPGRAQVTAAGWPATMTVLTNGSNVPGKIVKHNRNIQGLFSDLNGLVAARRNGRVRAGKKVFDIVKTNTARRMRHPKMRALVMSLHSDMTEEALKKVLKVVGLAALAWPVRESRAFLPSLSSLIQEFGEKGTFYGRNFIVNGRDAIDLNQVKHAYFALWDDFTEEDAIAQLICKMHGTVFLSREMVRAVNRRATPARAGVKARTSRIKKGGVDGKGKRYNVRRVSSSMEAYEVQRGQEGPGGGATWQISAVSGSGQSAFDKDALYAEMTGKGERAGGSTSKIMKMLANEMQTIDGEKEIEIQLRRKREGDTDKIKISARGFFNLESGEETQESERLLGRRIFEERQQDSESEEEEEEL